jgi:cell division transport system permease protein
LRLGLEGGAIGGGAAMLVFGIAEQISGWFSGTPVGDQFAALLGTFSLRPLGYLALAAQALLIAAITAWSSRRTLFATLEDIE